MKKRLYWLKPGEVYMFHPEKGKGFFSDPWVLDELTGIPMVYLYSENRWNRPKILVWKKGPRLPPKVLTSYWGRQGNGPPQFINTNPNKRFISHPNKKRHVFWIDHTFLKGDQIWQCSTRERMGNVDWSKVPTLQQAVRPIEEFIV